MAGRRRGKRLQHADGSVTVHGKNPNGEGSVYQMTDGRWAATWREPGRKNPRKATGKTRDEAIERRAERQGKPVSDDRVKTMADLSDWWLHHVHKGAVAASSWAKAEDRVNRITRTLGHLLPAEVTYAVVVEWQSGLLSAKADRDDDSNVDRGLAPKTVKLHRQTLAQIMDEGVSSSWLRGIRCGQ